MVRTPKLTLSPARDIPLDRLVLSQANVRRTQAGVSIEQLADDIARRTLLQGLVVRPVLDAEGAETGTYEVPAGGRRFRALELLVRQKRLARNAPVPCVVRTDGLAEEDSLAENVQRAPLHPLDQFRAFLTLRERGQGEEAIAAAFFVSVAVVRQRLRLASLSPRLLEAYAEDRLTLDQLMAFTVSPDHERQEQVLERLAHAADPAPYAIRRLLTEGAVRASDKRARLVGVDAYEAAGGTVLRDLFQGDEGGWLPDVAVLERLVAERLDEAAAAVRAEGWRWVEVTPDLPWDLGHGMRRLRGAPVPPTHAETAELAALRAELDGIEAEHATADELPEDVAARLEELEQVIARLEARPLAYAADDVARAGVFVGIAPDGTLRVERGYVRREDEPLAEPEVPRSTAGDTDAPTAGDEPHADGDAAAASAEPEEDEGMRPIPDRLATELTAHRTAALRQALGEQPDIALLAVVHALCLPTFYAYAQDSCLRLEPKSVGLAAHAPGLGDTSSMQALASRHEAWRAALPDDAETLWDALLAFDGDSRRALLAHCAALSVDAVVEPWNRRPKAIAHADRLAKALDLDMAKAGWAPTVGSYLGRVTKARIAAAVREARGERHARSLEGLRKSAMAARAEALLAGTGWLPEPLRTPGREVVRLDDGSDEDAVAATEVQPEAEPAAEAAVEEDDARADLAAQ